MIYLNNAATSLKRPPEVMEAVVRAMQTAGNASRGTDSASLAAARTIYQTREAIGELFHYHHTSRVIFTMNATEALNIVLLGLFRPGDHIITTMLEHNSVLRPLHMLETQGIRTDFVEADENGQLKMEQFESLICPETKAIVCTHASNLTGTLVDLKAVGIIARRHGLTFIVDAAQTAGEIPIDMEAMQIDILCFTGHKALMGPTGTGGMVIRDGIRIKPLLAGGTGIRSLEKEMPPGYPEHLEAGTLNTHGIAGLLAALSFIEHTGIDEIVEHERFLIQRLYKGVSEIPGIKVYGDFEVPRAPILSLNMEGVHASDLADVLTENYGISVRAGLHDAPLAHTALGTVNGGVVRFSVGFFNTAWEIDQTIAALTSIREEMGS